MPSAQTIAIAFLTTTAIATPVAGAPAPTTPPAQTAAAAPQLNIAITNGGTSASEGDQLRYVIKVHNLGTTDADELQISQSLPTGLTLVSADKGGTGAADRVTWTIKLKAGEESTLNTVGRVGKTPDDLLRLATVACAATKAGSKPLVCATHSDLLPAGAAAAAAARTKSSPSGVLWYALAAVGLVAIGLAGYVVVRRRRRTPPETLSETPSETTAGTALVEATLTNRANGLL